MNRGFRIVLASMVTFGMAAGAASAQQWGPSAQSKYYHNPGNPPTYMAYNTSSTGSTQTGSSTQSTVKHTSATSHSVVTHRRVATRRTAPARTSTVQ